MKAGTSCNEFGAEPPATLGQGIFVGWCGMRGFVVLATAFALPEWFTQRDVVVPATFCVVLATLVLQGSRLSPLVGLLCLDRRGVIRRLGEDFCAADVRGATV